MKKFSCHIIALTLTLQFLTITAVPDTRPAPEDRGASGLGLALRRLQTIASLLHTAAHPDDESTDLLAYLARAKGARVAYLALNRGEGGQNGIGPELGESLGVLRTEELLASRKLDGAEQYFSRAYDFGFTRSAEETLKKWNKEEILGDMVRVIRTFRPLVVANGFSGTPRDGHGQHQVAGMLAPEAVRAAADPNRYPEQIREGLRPWQVLKFYQRVFNQGGGSVATFDVGQFDPVLGRSPAELASEGRSKHRSQDFGAIQMRGSSVRSWLRQESKVPAPDRETSLFDGIDVSITGIAQFAGSGVERLTPSLTKIKEIASQAMAEYRVEDPEKIAPKLAEGLRGVRTLRGQLSGLDDEARVNVDTLLSRKEWEFADALAKAHGVIVDALSNAEIAAPGESIEVTANVYVGTRGNLQAAPQIKVAAPDNWRSEPLAIAEPEQNTPSPFFRGRERTTATSKYRVTIPADEPPSQPYWLARARTKDQFDWDGTMPVTLPFAPPRLAAKAELTLSGERVTITQPVEYRFADKTFGEIRREFKVAPALTVTMHPTLLVIPQGGVSRTREIAVEITNNALHAVKGSVKLVVPQGWRVEGGNQPLAFTRQGERAARVFHVTPPAGATGNFQLKAVAESGGQEYASGYTTIAYPHIETHFVYRPAEVRTELFDVKVAPGLNVGYVMGSGDDVPAALEQLGVKVKLIGGSELASGDLSVYDTIILGIRVYEVNEDVVANNKRLLDYVSNGGTLIVQYNKGEFSRGNFAPYPVKMDNNGLRVTDEEAPVKVLAPDHPLFNYPNRITEEDWKGWVQERGLYFLSEWDEKYTPLLASSDAPGKPLNGGQLIAQYGKGNYIYTGYAWFRQLPAGVPGAYRMFANLISLPKAGMKAKGQAGRPAQ
ncbi:MAG TPA: PIG-L family deacetylase [Blastocatellia bacterium]|nr:PIG-L family deacetylase [Blastocatellia bacterium]